MRDHRIDIIKAISIILVLFWHFQPLHFNIESGHVFSYMLNRINSYFLYEISLIAVPSFYFISLYLFSIRDKTASYVIKRILRLVELFLFWSIIQIGIYYIANNKLPLIDFALIRSGGPELPYVGGSVFYFLFNLIFLTLGMLFYLKNAAKEKFVLSFVITVISFVLFELAIFLPNSKVGHESLLNFLYLIPLVYLFNRMKNTFLKQRYKLLTSFILLTFHDIILREYFHYSWPLYGRLSIVLGTITFISFIFSYNFTKTIGTINQTITLVAKYSLGIFAIHKYCQYISTIMYHNYSYSFYFIDLKYGFIFINSIVFIIIFIWLCSNTFLKRYIS
jgi:hypothetical protein